MATRASMRGNSLKKLDAIEANRKKVTPTKGGKVTPTKKAETTMPNAHRALIAKMAKVKDVNIPFPIEPIATFYDVSPTYLLQMRGRAFSANAKIAARYSVLKNLVPIERMSGRTIGFTFDSVKKWAAIELS